MHESFTKRGKFTQSTSNWFIILDSRHAGQAHQERSNHAGGVTPSSHNVEQSERVLFQQHAQARLALLTRRALQDEVVRPGSLYRVVDTSSPIPTSAPGWLLSSLQQRPGLLQAHLLAQKQSSNPVEASFRDALHMQLSSCKLP
jgi:hypothetical protein